MMTVVPHDLIFDILCRVPVKYLLRCRCVSKHWCSLIDSTDFVQKHHSTSLKCNRGGIIITGRSKCYLANYDNDVCNAIEINDPLKSLFFDNHFVGSANGLVCLSNLLDDVIVLFNPSTRKCTKLPMEPAQLTQSFYHDSEIDLCGFGYDHLSDDYKVVKVALREATKKKKKKKPALRQFYESIVLVYSLKTNSWTRLQNVRVSSRLCFNETWGTFASGALYWPAYDAESDHSVNDICLTIVRFDFGLEQFTEVIDSVAAGDTLSPDRLVAFGGSLHILDYYYSQSHVDVSQINDYGMKNSRFKVFSVNASAFGNCRFRPLVYSKNHQEVLIQADYRKLMWYHLQSEACRKVLGIPEACNSHSYTESIFQFTEGSSSAETIT